MAKYEWSEVFLSIEGEGPYSGHPTVYIRFAKCNFQCMGFNNPEMKPITNEVLGFNPANYKSLKELPMITIGCDSIYSWDKRFAHMWHKGDENDLANATLDVVPHRSWLHPVTGQPVILSLTGGEPTLRAKTIPTLLEHELFNDLEMLLFETNCSVPLKQEFIDQLNEWTDKNYARTVVWSNSPKLSVSGEKWKEAIRPEIAVMQRGVWECEQYFKFVCGPRESDFDEVEKAMDAYLDAGIGEEETVRVYIMPEACTEEQQFDIAAEVAKMCMDRGYIYCHRIQNSVFGNTIGT